MKNQLNQLTSDPRRYVRKKLEKRRRLQQFSTSLYLKYCSLTGCFHVLPDFLIIGFVKCGTTSLYQYLIQHPDVFSAKGKEIDYFDRLYQRGLNWYRVGFPFKPQKSFVKNILKKNFLTGEATPRYIEHAHALDRIKKTIPNAKFIVLLRNPIDRAFSHYNMNMTSEYEYLTFEDALKHEEKRIHGRYEKMQRVENYYSWDHDLYGYLKHGIYVKYLKRWMDVFPREQFLILQTEEFKKNTSVVYNKALQFLNLTKYDLKEYPMHKKIEYKKRVMKPETRKQLNEYFKPHNEELYKFLGTNFHWDEEN